MIIGDIIRVEDARTYVAKIPPDARKERIGTFIKIKKDDGFTVGVITNIINSIHEDLIPYILPDMQPKYAPFNEDFRNSYYVLYGLGVIQNGTVTYDVYLPPDVRDNVMVLDPEELKAFHTVGGKPSIAYFRSNCNALPYNVLIAMIDQIEELHPGCKAMLKLIRNYIRRNL